MLELGTEDFIITYNRFCQRSRTYCKLTPNIGGTVHNSFKHSSVDLPEFPFESEAKGYLTKGAVHAKICVSKLTDLSCIIITLCYDVFDLRGNFNIKIYCKYIIRFIPMYA